MNCTSVKRFHRFELTTVGVAIAAACIPVAPGVIERWFSLRIYPNIQHTLTPVSNALPFALLDVVIAAAFAAIVIMMVHGVASALRARRVFPVMRTLGHLAAGAALLYLTFLLLWGFNYRRVPMTDRVRMDRALSPDAVVRLGLEAAAQLNDLHDAAHASGWRQPPWEDAGLRQSFADIQRKLTDAPPAVTGRLKSTLLGAYFRWASVDGMINPFGLEVLANPDLLPFERPFVAAHEWSHLAGYADESEASFVGWLTCVRAGTEAQYSGWLALYWQVDGEVTASEREQLAKALGPGPRRDLQAVVDRVRRGRWPWLQAAGWRVYDEYLKANRVEEGVRSYGAVITLILRARFDEGWLPVRQPGV